MWEGKAPKALPDGWYIAVKADADDEMADGPWRPSIFMPRWASCITLTLTDVRVQRLKDITPEDAIAEGAPDTRAVWDDYSGPEGGPCAWYASLWDRINGAGAWDANPWIWALSFSVEVRS